MGWGVQTGRKVFLTINERFSAWQSCKLMNYMEHILNRVIMLSVRPCVCSSLLSARLGNNATRGSPFHHNAISANCN